jgi:multiple sugar transport system substrate-binding protein
VRARRVVVTALAIAVAAGTAAACTSDGDDQPGPADPSSTAPSKPVTPVKLTFGVWGADPEVAAYQSAVDAYNAKTSEAQVKVKDYASREDLKAALDSGQVPDVFLVGRGDLADLEANKVNQPVGDLLDERDVEFGDGYSRPSLEAFASDRELQCMPYGISTMVVYYNKALVDFTKMAAKGIEVPDVDDEDFSKKPTWTLQEFQAASEFASRPRKGVAGFYVAPTLRGLAPFVYSGGGALFDDQTAPTSLAFSSDETRNALEKVLPLLRDPKETLSADQLAEKPALDWFEDGKLGMIAGFRDLTPELRQSGVDFDVLPMPVVDDPATIGDLTGICISAKTPDLAESADFLADFVSKDSVSMVAESGYLAPANVQVSLSDAFLEPGQLPLHASVFNNSIKNMRIPPLLNTYNELEDAVADPIRQLLEVEVPDLDALTEQIDTASQTVLAPPPTETPSPDADTSESPSGE